MKVDRLASLLIATIVFAAPLVAYAMSEDTNTGKYTGAYSMASLSGKDQGPDGCTYCSYGEWKSMIWDLQEGIDWEYLALNWWHAYFDGCNGKWVVVTGGTKIVYDPGEPGRGGNPNAIEHSSFSCTIHCMIFAESYTRAIYTDHKVDAVADAMDSCGGAT